MTNVKDTIINGKQMRNFVGLSQMRHIFNIETQRHDIPLQYEYNTWINPDHHVDSVVCIFLATVKIIFLGLKEICIFAN